MKKLTFIILCLWATQSIAQQTFERTLHGFPDILFMWENTDGSFTGVSQITSEDRNRPTLVQFDSTAFPLNLITIRQFTGIYPRGAMPTSDNNIAILTEETFPYVANSHSRTFGILIVDPNGKAIMKMKFTSANEPKGFIQMADSGFAVLTSQSFYDSTGNKSRIIFLDKNLDSIGIYRFLPNDHYADKRSISIKKTDEGGFEANMTYNLHYPPYGSKLLHYEFDQNKKLKKKLVIDVSQNPDKFDIIGMADSQYIVVYEYTKTDHFGTYQVQIFLRTDKNGEIVSTYNPINGNAYIILLKLDSLTFLTASGNNEALTVSKMDTSFHQLDHLYLGGYQTGEAIKSMWITRDNNLFFHLALDFHKPYCSWYGYMPHFCKVTQNFDGDFTYSLQQMGSSIKYVTQDSAGYTHIFLSKPAHLLSVEAYIEKITVSYPYGKTIAHLPDDSLSMIDSSTAFDTDPVYYTVRFHNNYSSTHPSNKEGTAFLTVQPGGTGGVFNLSWKKYKSDKYIYYYNVYRGSDSTSLKLLATVTPDILNFTDTDIKGKNIYYYVEAAIGWYSTLPDSNYYISRSNTVHVINNGIEAPDNNYPLIQPNPSNSTFYLDNLSPGSQISVYSQDGRQIYYSEITGTNHIVDLSSEKAGIYFTRITGKDRTYVVKILKE